jgi:hypothetical protein
MKTRTIAGTSAAGVATALALWVASSFLVEVSPVAKEWQEFPKQFADREPPPYGDFGQWEAIVFKQTGNKSYARRAIDAASAAFKPLPSDLNDSREYAHVWPVLYEALQGDMTAKEREEWKTKLSSWSQFMVSNTRLNDSDVVVGHYFPILKTDGLLGTTYSSNPIVPQMWEAILSFLVHAKNGEWIEAAVGYNEGTSQILLMGAWSVSPDLSRFPEIKAWLPELAKQLQWNITSNLKQPAHWGDIEHPRDILAHSRLPLMALVVGLGGDQDGKLLALLSRLAQQYKPIDLYHTLYRTYWVFDSSLLQANPLADNPQGIRTTGPGLTIFRKGDDFLNTFSANPVGVDHQMNDWDVRLYKDGEWLLDHPLCYAPWGVFNSGKVFGLGPMADRKTVSADVIEGKAKIIMETKGERYNQPYWDPPPAFLTLWRRTILYGTELEIRDDFEGTEPTRLDRYYSWDSAAISSRKHNWEQTFHSKREPTETPDGFIYLLDSGTPVKITSDAPYRSKELEVKNVNVGTYMSASEEGWWMMRLSSDTPNRTSITTRVGKDTIPIPPPPNPVIQFPLRYANEHQTVEVFEDRIEIRQTLPRSK